MEITIRWRREGEGGVIWGEGARGAGQAVCWGFNKNGQANPPGGSDSACAAGSTHSCRLRGQAVCWGSDAYT